MEIDERHEIIRKEQLEKVKTGNSVFGKVPSEIGIITFCDSSTWDEKAPTIAEANKIRIWCFVIGAGIIAFFWSVFPNAMVLNIIVTIIVSIYSILLILLAGEFSGTDYFIGDQGFAVMKFKRERHNFIKKDVVKFSEVSDVVDSEIDYYDSKGNYERSMYSYYFHNVYRKELYDISAHYSFIGLHKKLPWQEIDFRFWKKLEDAWYDYYIKELAYINNEMGGTFVFVMFESANKEDLSRCNATPFAVIEGEKLILGDRTFTPESIRKIYIDKGVSNKTHERKGMLVIEGIDYTPKKMFKKESGTIERIPLANVGNCRIFIKVIENYIKQNNINS
ncbi:MAG: hypothetical protein J5797_07500 [Prevotella sp.]|nr:hypothetical protein [Prevotella sp.]